MDLDEYLSAIKLLQDVHDYEAWRRFIPVPKQEEFMAAGATFRDRIFLAGNGCGKTATAGYEVSRHLTGVYPPWWKGYRFQNPVRAWVCGTSDKAVAEAAQTKLLGTPGVKEHLGTGFIPKEAIIEGSVRNSRGYPDAVASFQVRCRVNGRNDESAISRVLVKTYSQDREDWQGADIDLYWPDEEPPENLDGEGRARLRGKGIILMTLTPTQGWTPVLTAYRDEAEGRRSMTVMPLTVEACPWKTPEEVANAIADFPVRERSARSTGMPMLGSGAIFTTPVEDLIEPTIPLSRVPAHWTKLWGLDFGGGSEFAHPFAAVLYALDREEGMPALGKDGPIGTVHILHEVRMTNALIVQHADAMKRVAGNVPVAWPHDGNVAQRGETKAGEPLASLYRRQGLNMLETHATHVAGGFSTYAGIMDMDAYMQARQFKVGAHCVAWLSEYGQYHFDDKGLIVKIRDDLMSATRIAHIMRRRARAVPLGSKMVRPLRRRQNVRINPWTGREEQ